MTNAAWDDRRERDRPASERDAPPPSGDFAESGDLDLQVKPEIKARRRVETALARDSAEHGRIVEALSEQRRSLNAIREAVAAHVAEVQRIEERLRNQVSDSDHVRKLVEDLQASRRAIGEDFSALTSRLDTLSAAPHASLDAERGMEPSESSILPAAETSAAAPDAALTDEYWRAKWQELAADWPDVFDATHTPNRRTFDNLCEAFVEMARLNVVIDEGVRGTLTQLRRSGDESDRLSTFVVRFMKQPKLVQTLREYLLSRRKTGALGDALRALRAWVLALANGLFTAIVHGPKVAEPVLDPTKWDMKKGSFETQEAATGRHYREQFRNLCASIGTELRKEANNCVFDDYKDMIQLRK